MEYIENLDYQKKEFEEECKKEQEQEYSKRLVEANERKARINAKREQMPIVFPDKTSKGNAKKTLHNFKLVLFMYEISLKYDVIKRELMYSIGDKVPKRDYDNFLTYCVDICCESGLPATRIDIHNWLYYIANEGRFNAVKNMLQEFHSKYNIQPNDTSEFEKLMDCIKFQGDADFSRTLVKKALWQAVAMVHNENGEYGADGALTIQGNQGIGKTSFLRKMCECFGLQYFRESGAFNQNSLKDDVLQNTSYFICELGEAGSSLSQVDWLKRFITNPTDEIRPPYGMKAKVSPRLTTFFLTINDLCFLRDTENRRYWTVQIKDFALNEINNINFGKMWAEVYRMYLNNPVGFRLTVDERKQLQKINSDFRIYTREEQVLRDAYDWEQPVEDWKEKTSTEIATEVLEITGQRISPQKIGKALAGFGYSKESEKYQKRILDGKTLYLVPKVIAKMETGQPFDNSSRGKVIPILQNETKKA